MFGRRLRKGMHLLFAGREYTIEQRLPSGELQLKDVATSECGAFAETVLVEALFGGSLELLGEEREYTRLQLKIAKTFVSDLTALEDDDARKQQAMRRLAYIKEVIRAKLTVLTEEVLRPIIEKVSREISDAKPPCSRSIRRWYNEYIATGEDVRALIPSYKARGNGKSKISEDVEKSSTVLRLIEECINEEFLRLERPTVQSVYDTLVARIIRENRFRNEGDKLPIPHKSTVYRIIAKLDPYERDKARLGKRIADAKHRSNQQGARPTRPLERVECDDTKLDLFVYDPEHMMPLGRPWLISLIDVFTKMILGFYLSFVNPSYLSVQQCLLHAIRPKTYVRNKYPNIVNTWEAYGLMEVLVVDNAKHWHSRSFDEACIQLGIEVQYAPVRHPWFKPSIERFFGSLNKRLLHLLPGTTFSNIFEKADYDPEKNAIISLNTLDEVLHVWNIDIYQQSKHRGINDVPVRLWRQGIKEFPPTLPNKKTELEVLLGHIEHRVISKSGVELFGLYYNDSSLAAVRSGLEKGERVKVKYDPTDLSLIHVHDAHMGRYLPVPALNQEYARGLTLWQHNVIRRHARQEVDEYVDITALSQSKMYIKELVKKALGTTRKARTNVKIARWLNSGTENTRVHLNKSEPEADTGELNSAPLTLKSLGSTPQPSSKPKARVKRRSRSHPAEDSKGTKSMAAAGHIDDSDELDMTGWSSDYNLPT